MTASDEFQLPPSKGSLYRIWLKIAGTVNVLWPYYDSTYLLTGIYCEKNNKKKNYGGTSQEWMNDVFIFLSKCAG